MTDPLRPTPMTHEQITDLVTRVRSASRMPVASRGHNVLKRARSEEAARWARANRETCAAAAAKFGRSCSAVVKAWHRVFGCPARRWRRSA